MSSEADILKRFTAIMQAEYRACLTCERSLEEKELKKGLTRCRKCQRELSKVWPTDEKEFYGIFDGQY